MEAAKFLHDLIPTIPYRIHTMLTDNSIQFTPRRQRIGDVRQDFDRVCDEHGIDHRLTKVNYPSAGFCLQSLQEPDRWFC